MSWIGRRKMKPGLRPRPIRTKDKTMRKTRNSKNVYERNDRNGTERSGRISEKGSHITRPGHKRRDGQTNNGGEQERHERTVIKLENNSPALSERRRCTRSVLGRCRMPEIEAWLNRRLHILIEIPV